MAAGNERAPRKKAAAKKPAPRSKKAAAKKAAPRKRAPKKAVPTPDQERAVTWAVAHGAPIRMLEGWDPTYGRWAEATPVGQLLHLIRNGAHLAVAARRAGISHISQLMTTCAEFAEAAPENREYIPIEARPFVDLHRAVERAESGNEIEVIDVVMAKVRSGDAQLAMTFLSRRYPARWREQQQVLQSDDADLRDQAVANLLADPKIAIQLASLADAVEDEVEAVETGGGD